MTTTVLVDTDVFSFLLRGDTRAELFRNHLENKVVALSFQTLAELYRGAFEREWGELRLARLERALHAALVLPFTYDTAVEWGRIVASSRRAGMAISVQDAWIASTAIAWKLPLATNNRKDFAHIQGLELLSPSP